MPELPPECLSKLIQIWTVLVGSNMLERLSTVPAIAGRALGK